MFEAYHVAVRLRLLDHVSGGLVHLSHQFARTHGHAAALQRQLNQIRLTAMSGFAVGAVGLFGLMTLRGPYEAARNFNTEVARFNALGLGDHAREEALHFTAAMDEIGTSLTEKMALFRDAATVFRGDMHHAEMVTPTLARMRFAMETLYGGEHGGHAQNERQFMDLLRVMELRGGLVSEEAAREQMNYAFQAITTSGNRVNPQALLAFMQTAGTTGRSLSNEALFFAFEPIIQEMGGPRAGTAWQTLARRLSLGQFVGSGGKLAGEEMLRLGLLDRSGVEFDHRGGFRRYRPGASPLMGQDLLISDPYRWYNEVLAPAYARAGIDTEAEFFRTNSLIGGRTGSRLLDIFRVQNGVINRGITMARGAMNIDQAYYAAMDTERGLEIGTSKKWHDLMVRLGQAVLPMAVAGMQALVPMLESMEQWVTRNPGKVRVLVTAFVALSGSMLFGGVVLLLSAAFRGLGLALSLLFGRGALLAGIRMLSMGLIPALTALAGVLGWPALLIGGLVIALGLLGKWFYDNVEPFRNAVDGIIGHLSRMLDWLTEKARPLLERLTGSDGRPAIVAPHSVTAMLARWWETGNPALNPSGQPSVRDAWATARFQAPEDYEATRRWWEFRRQSDAANEALTRGFNANGSWYGDRGADATPPWVNREGPSPYVRLRPSNENTPSGDVYLDGRIVGSVVADRMNSDMRSAAVAAARPDQNRAAPPAAMPYAPR